MSFIHWAHHWAIPIIAAWVAATILVAVVYTAAHNLHLRRRAARADENLLAHGAKLIAALNAEAERLWPDGDDNQPWPGRNATVQHVGRHAAVWQTPLDDQPADVILAVVTEVQKRKQR